MIRLDSLSKSFGDKTILSDINYHFPKNERIALIGANGQGKTTLLNIITKKDYSDFGEIMSPKNMRMSFLPQSFNDNHKQTIFEECVDGHKIIAEMQIEMDSLLQKVTENYNEKDYLEYEHLLKKFEELGGYSIDGIVKKILLGLGFKEEQFNDSPAVLSGGWRMRLELAKVLVANPDFLILDEPTNHLDLPSIEWLENYLKEFQGTLVFVSHDREFINNLATIVLYLHNGKLEQFVGNFDAFLGQQEQAQKTQEATVRKIKQKQAHMQSFVNRFRAKASKAKQASSRIKMIDRLQEIAQGIEGGSKHRHISIPKLECPPSGKEVFTLEKVDVGYSSSNILVNNVTINIRKGQKIAIIGANGIGKSTLLKTISGLMPPISGEIVIGHNVRMGVYTQDAADKIAFDNKNKTVMEVIQNACPEISEQTHRRLLGSFIFSRNDWEKSVSVLSGGEKSRLAFCCLLGNLPNTLILDEPTNHLDMASTEIIADMLSNFPGTVLFVSHDRYFVDQVASSVIEIIAKKAVF